MHPFEELEEELLGLGSVHLDENDEDFLEDLATCCEDKASQIQVPKAPRWFRKLLRKEQNFLCRMCGTASVEIKHHPMLHPVVPYHLGGDTEHMDNHMLVCRGCHAKRKNRDLRAPGLVVQPEAFEKRLAEWYDLPHHLLWMGLGDNNKRYKGGLLKREPFERFRFFGYQTQEYLWLVCEQTSEVPEVLSKLLGPSFGHAKGWQMWHLPKEDLVVKVHELIEHGAFLVAIEEGSRDDEPPYWWVHLSGAGAHRKRAMTPQEEPWPREKPESQSPSARAARRTVLRKKIRALRADKSRTSRDLDRLEKMENPVPLVINALRKHYKMVKSELEHTTKECRKLDPRQ